jgi:hypothetical protein
MPFLPFRPLRRRLTASVAAVLTVALLPVLSQAPSAVAASDEPSSAAASNGGYWLVGSDGGVFAYGDARFLGSTGNIKLNQPIVGMASTPSGNGYWMVASDGGIFAFGDAAFQGSTGNIKLNKPIVGMASTPSGKGYWLVASDGGIFAFGDASFFGSTGNIKLNQPITGIAPTPTGQGYWMTANDGGVFSFGDAAFKGAAPSVPPTGPRKIVAMVPSPSGQGYWQVSATGELLAFGDAAKLGAPSSVNREIVGMAAFRPAGTVPNGLRDTVVDNTMPGPIPTDTTATTQPTGYRPPQYFANDPNPTWSTSPSEDPTETTNKAGKVLAIAEVGDKVFLAGEFAGVMPPGISTNAARRNPSSVVRRPFLVAFDVNTGALLDWDAHPDNAVLSLAVSADGTKLYAGGRFRKIGGAPSSRLAVLDVATGLADPTFKPELFDGGVKALALHGNTIYAGGEFTNIGTTPRPQVAALDATTGAVRTDWVPPVNAGGRYVGHTGTPTEDGNDGLVYDMAVTADGSILYVGGDFLHFGGQGGLLALDAATGQAITWQPVVNRPVFGLTVWPGDGKTLIIATGGTGGTAQMFVPGGSTKAKWIGRADGDATDVAATTERVYLVGHYDHEVANKDDPCLKIVPVYCANGDPHRKLAAFDARTGNVDPSFTAQANTPQGPYVALIGANHLYVGGDFTEAGPVDHLKPHPGFAQFDRISKPGPAPPVTTTTTSTTTTTR